MLSNKDYCDYDTSITLGELGFPLKRMKVKNFIDGKFSDSIVTVLLYEAQKWLREEKKIIVLVDIDHAWYYGVYTLEGNNYAPHFSGEEFGSYEEALLEGVKSAIKILKEK